MAKKLDVSDSVFAELYSCGKYSFTQSVLTKKMRFTKKSSGKRKPTVLIESDLFGFSNPNVVAKNGLMNIKIHGKIETSHLLIN